MKVGIYVLKVGIYVLKVGIYVLKVGIYVLKVGKPACNGSGWCRHNYTRNLASSEILFQTDITN